MSTAAGAEAGGPALSWRTGAAAAGAATLLHLLLLTPWPGPADRFGIARPVALQVRTLEVEAVEATAVPPPAANATPTPREPLAARAPAAPDASAGALAGAKASSPRPAAARPAGDAASSPVPVYRTRLAPDGQWRFVVRRAGREGLAQLRWHHDDERYEASLAAEGDASSMLQWTSRGAIDDAGLAPERFVDRRDRRREAANFDRATGLIAYSGRAAGQPLFPGGQDRLSVLLQLAAVLDARQSPASAGEVVTLQVSGAHGDAAVWRFEVEGPSRVTLADGSVRWALKLQREPEGPYDTRVELWADPARHHLPLKVVMRNGAHVFELVMQGDTDTPAR